MVSFWKRRRRKIMLLFLVFLADLGNRLMFNYSSWMIRLIAAALAFYCKLTVSKSVNLLHSLTGRRYVFLLQLLFLPFVPAFPAGARWDIIWTMSWSKPAAWRTSPWSGGNVAPSPRTGTSVASAWRCGRPAVRPVTWERLVPGGVEYRQRIKWSILNK